MARTKPKVQQHSKAPRPRQAVGLRLPARPSISFSEQRENEPEAKQEEEHKHEDDHEETYQKHHSRVTEKQLELQTIISKREKQITALINRAKGSASTKNQKLFIQFLRTLSKQYHDIASKNRQVATVREVEENKRAMDKLIWFDQLEQMPDEEEVAVEGRGLINKVKTTPARKRVAEVGNEGHSLPFPKRYCRARFQ